MEEPAPIIASEPIIEPESVSTEAVIEESEPVIIPEPIIEPEPVSESEVVVEEPESVIEQAQVAVSELAIEPESVTEVKQSDVSEGIISNFAKMFAHEEENHEVPSPVDHITTVGDASKSLEEFVREAVIKVVGEEIKKQWNDGADYQSFAEAEIKRQTEEWINNNLPTMVETIIKQEITRVIAKVGS